MLGDSTNPVVERIIEASGLAPLIAAGVVKRCCARANLAPRDLTFSDVPTLLPLMEPLLKLYLKPDELTRHMAALKGLARAA